jgi:hypothetical protein
MRRVVAGARQRDQRVRELPEVVGLATAVLYARIFNT